MTVSPNRRHSTMILKLSRARASDVGLTGTDATCEWRRRYAGSEQPPIFCKSTVADDAEGEQVIKEISLPELSVRQAWNAQDPLSSVHHYLVFMYVVMPALFGLRMCLNCPDCNGDPNEPGSISADFGCQACSDCLGSNGKLMGGYAGLATGLAFATEFQGDGTPHAHGFVSLANMYQHRTLKEIGDLIECNHQGMTAESVLERIVKFTEHLQREDHFNNEEHQSNLDSLERQFHDNNEGPARNHYLSLRSRPLYECAGKPYLWSTSSAHSVTSSAHSETCAALVDAVHKEAEEFQRIFEADVQFVSSRVQHHWHPRNKNGKREPMPYCRPASRKCTRCKRDFPKKVLKDAFGKVRPDRYRARIVCRGVAAELDLKTSGRRNALGSILGRRQCEYFSSTSALLAQVSRSNSNVQCNYRVPITAATHDKDCKAPSCVKLLSTRRLCLIAQRAMKQMTGYFGGYISKKQKIGQFEIKKSISALPLLKEKLQSRGLKSASSQLAHVVNRMFSTVESRLGRSRPMTSVEFRVNEPFVVDPYPYSIYPCIHIPVYPYIHRYISL